MVHGVWMVDGWWRIGAWLVFMVTWFCHTQIHKLRYLIGDDSWVSSVWDIAEVQLNQMVGTSQVALANLCVQWEGWKKAHKLTWILSKLWPQTHHEFEIQETIILFHSLIILNVTVINYDVESHGQLHSPPEPLLQISSATQRRRAIALEPQTARPALIRVPQEGPWSPSLWHEQKPGTKFANGKFSNISTRLYNLLLVRNSYDQQYYK